MNRLNERNISLFISKIAEQEPALRRVYQQYGFPPLWHYEPGFVGLIQIILGQQVSVASAAAAFRKLEAQIEEVAPARLLAMSDEDLRACYFSRQKTSYARSLAAAIREGQLDLEQLNEKPDEVVRRELTKIRGIGDWTVDIYLLLALHRSDVFPPGDLAAKAVLKELRLVPETAGKAELLDYADRFRPHRSALTLLLWHKYIEDRGIRFMKH